eukprot:m.251928 g.251928  ORF g.251928 m.251928 type:complete len:721 (+) comp33901_c3_seq32:429-2591(+)
MTQVNRSLSTVVLALALMAVKTTTAIQFTVATTTSSSGNTDDDGEIFFLVGGSYTSKQDHHRGSKSEVDTKTYTTNSNPTKLKLCIDGSDSWTYVSITINGASIFSGADTLDDDACKEYTVPSSVFIPTGYTRVVATTGGGANDDRSDPVEIFFLVSNSVVYEAEFFDNTAKNEQFDKTYEFYGNVKPDEVRFCPTGGSTWDKWKLSTLVVNGQSIDANDDVSRCRDYSIPVPYSYSTKAPTKAPTASTSRPTKAPTTSAPTTPTPTTQPTKAPTISQPTSFPTNGPTTASPTASPTHAPTNRPTQAPTLPKCRCAVTWSDSRDDACSFNVGCPLQPCDNDHKGASWCRVRNSPCAGEETTLGGRWSFCNPLETWPPTSVPTSSSPTIAPTTSTPTTSPTTSSPTTSSPTKQPSISPTRAPTVPPTSHPTTSTPTTSTPTTSPTQIPTTPSPTRLPSMFPTTLPTAQPTKDPTVTEDMTTTASKPDTSTLASSDNNNSIVLAVLVVFFGIAICFGCYLGYLRWKRNKEKDVGTRDGFQNPMYKQGSLFDSGNSLGYIEISAKPGQFINPKYALPSQTPRPSNAVADDAYEEPVMLKKPTPLPTKVVTIPPKKAAAPKTSNKRQPPSDDYYDTATADVSPPTATTTTTVPTKATAVLQDDLDDDGVYNNMGANGQQVDGPTDADDDEEFDGFYGPVGDETKHSINLNTNTNDSFTEYDFGS